MSDDYYEGKGCKCFARNQDECACSADWTPKEVYKLRKRIVELEKERDSLKFANTEAKEYIESELGSVFITVCPSKPFNPKENQAKRDLEQQAKGIEECAKALTNGMDAVWMLAKASKLREKTKGDNQ